MQQVTSLNAANIQISQHPGGIRRVRGNYNGAANAWLWLFDTNGKPLTTTTGLISPTPLYTGAAFFIDESHGSLQFNTGLYAAVSSNQETYTASASTMDITVEMDDPEEPSNNTYGGDTTTGRNLLIVYATNPALNLYAFTVTNNDSGPDSIMLFTAANPATGSFPLLQWKVAAGATLICKFGRQGYHPISGAYPNQTEGCYLYGSSTARTYTPSSGNLWNIQAEYGAPQNG